MNSRIVKFFFNKITVALALTGVLLVPSMKRGSTQGEIDQISLMLEGAQTCFYRVYQSYVSKIMGISNSYLKRSFMGTTEECYGDLLQNLSDNFELTMRENLTNLNKLATDVHWFHSELKAEKTVLSSIHENFSNIEGADELVRTQMEKYRASLRENIVYYQYAFMFFLLVTLLFFTKEILARKNQMTQKVSREETEQKTQVKAEQEYSWDWSEEHDEEEGNSVENILNNVISRVSAQIFQYGILVDIGIPPETTIPGKEEDLLQTFYNVVVNALNSLKLKKGFRKLEIRAKRLGGTLCVEFLDNGAGFDSHLISSKSKDGWGMGLHICQELAHDLNAEMNLVNYFDENQNVLGAQVQFIFRVMKKQRKRETVKIVRGKKRDLIKEFSIS